MIEIRISTDTMEQAIAEAHRLAHAASADAVTVLPTKVADAPKKDKAKKEGVPTSGTGEPAPGAPSPAPTAAVEIKVADVSAMVSTLLNKVKREVVVALLAEFGVKKGSDVPPAKFGEFMTKANELLK